MSASGRWAAELAAWAIDPEVLAAAPESPYGFPAGLFGTDRGAPVPHQALREVAPRRGQDIGSGRGAASPPVGAPELLGRFAAAAGPGARTWCGRWPDVADQVPVADVVVSANVVYNVPDIADFVTALNRHARRRVVVELTDVHPWTSMAGLWRHFHHQERPDGPTAELFADVLTELGLDWEHRRWTRADPWRDAPADVVLAFTRRRLCLPASRDDEVAAAMARLADDRPRTATTYWWDGSADRD